VWSQLQTSKNECNNECVVTVADIGECMYVVMSVVVVDIQECVDQADMCREHAHSLCIEDEGKYACTCSHGYKLNPDGMSCSGRTHR